MSEQKPDPKSSSAKLLSVFLPLSFIGSLAILFVLLFRAQTLSDLSGQLESGAVKKGQITTEIEQLQERLTALKEDASTTQAHLTALTEQREAAIELIGQAAAAEKTLERLRADAASAVEDANRQQINLTASLDQIRAAIVTAEADSKTRKTELEDSLQQLRKDQESGRKVIAEQRKLFEENSLALAHSEQDISTANDKLGALKAQVVQADSQIKAKNADLQDIEDRIAALQAKASARIGTDKTPSELAADIGELKREISDLRQKLAEPASKRK